MSSTNNARPAYWNPGHFRRGDKVKCGDYIATIIRYYYDGMWEVRLPGGEACVSGERLQILDLQLA